MLGPILYFAVAWTLAWRRYNQADGTVVDLIVWLSVGAFLYIAGAWLLLHFG